MIYGRGSLMAPTSGGSVATGDTTQSGAATGHHPKKLLSHNHLLKTGEGLEKAFELAQGMGIDYIRTDLEWRTLDTAQEGRWLWDVADSPTNHWTRSVGPALECTRQRGMGTLVVVKVTDCPGYLHQAYMDSYRARWDGLEGTTPWWRLRPSLEDRRHAALWAAWAEKRGALGTDGPFNFLDELLRVLSAGVADGKYSIVGFNIENEPNVDNMPHQDNFKRLLLPTGTEGEGSRRRTAFTTYTTADLVKDVLHHVKEWCANDPYLRDAITVVNLHSYDRHWDKRTWRDVGLGNPDLDVLGIDIYPTHFGTGTSRDKRNMRRLSAEYGKPWWVVEMEGAPSPPFWPWQRVHSGYPDVDTCRDWAQECAGMGAAVVGFYRLWGTYDGKMTSYDRAYNIYQDPGPNPRETVVKGKSYAAMIRDLFEG